MESVIIAADTTKVVGVVLFGVIIVFGVVYIMIIGLGGK